LSFAAFVLFFFPFYPAAICSCLLAPDPPHRDLARVFRFFRRLPSNDNIQNNLLQLFFQCRLRNPGPKCLPLFMDLTIGGSHRNSVSPCRTLLFTSVSEGPPPSLVVSMRSHPFLPYSLRVVFILGSLCLFPFSRFSPLPSLHPGRIPMPSVFRYVTVLEPSGPGSTPPFFSPVHGVNRGCFFFNVF